MSLESWNTFLNTLKSKEEAGYFPIQLDRAPFTGFVNQLSGPDRVRLLLFAYEQRSGPGACGVSLEASAYSILIAALLATKLNPTPAEALQILSCARHSCGHGSDVEPPLALAERAFQGTPYTP